jgi:hypothetical protein
MWGAEWKKTPRTEQSPYPTLAGAKQAVEKERKSWGLFADQVELETPEDRVQRLGQRNIGYRATMRSNKARWWWEARRSLAQLSEKDRTAVIDHWNAPWYPRDSPVYLCDLIHCWARDGKIEKGNHGQDGSVHRGAVSSGQSTGIPKKSL